MTAIGTHQGRPVGDSVEWSLQTSDVNIQSGRVASGYVAANGQRFGSDYFFTGGAAGSTDSGDVDGGVPEDIEGTADPFLYKFYRHGEFSYDIPLTDGTHEVTLGFIEPDLDAEAGDRVFNVTANEQILLDNFDILREAGETRTAVMRTFTVAVSGGSLKLSFTPVEGDALVSNIQVKASAAGATSTPATDGPDTSPLDTSPLDTSILGIR